MLSRLPDTGLKMSPVFFFMLNRLRKRLQAPVRASAVGPSVRLAGLKMMVHLRVQCPLGQSLLQLIQQAVLVERRLRVGSGQS
jgi:hypothetical protein